MTAMSYRPSDELYARVRRAAAERDVSIQALIDTAVSSYLDSQEHDLRAMTASLIRRNRVLLDRLAEL